MLLRGLSVHPACRRDRSYARNAPLARLFGCNLLLNDVRRASRFFGRRQPDQGRECRCLRRRWRWGGGDGCGLSCARRGCGRRLLRRLLITRTFERNYPHRPGKLRLWQIFHHAWARTARAQDCVRRNQSGDHHDACDSAAPRQPEKPGFLQSVHGTCPTALRACANESAMAADDGSVERTVGKVYASIGSSSATRSVIAMAARIAPRQL